MIINVNTKIASIIKHNAAALEAIISISPRFVKLRNPVLRKVIAGRTSIATASKLGGCSVDDFFTTLQPLGFDIDKNINLKEQELKPTTLPDFFKTISKEKIIELDVRPVIESGKDPLQIILDKVKGIRVGEVLQIVNSFEPTPLIHLLGKQGFKSFTEHINETLINTYFYKTTTGVSLPQTNIDNDSQDWDAILKRFEGKLEITDVRQMEMPLPMHTIMNALKTLPGDSVLLVHHKRIPVFLLPELEEQKFSYRIKEISDTEVQLLIYKD